jgi:hypothetical protein
LREKGSKVKKKEPNDKERDVIVSAISATEAPAKTIVLLETKIKLLRVCLRVYITRCTESLTWFGPVVLFAFYQIYRDLLCAVYSRFTVVRVYHVSRSR